MNYRLAMIFGLLTLALPGRADPVSKRIEYRFENASYVGYLTYDPAAPGRRPGVLVADEWGGADAHTKAVGIARLGYVVFTVDLFGKDVVPKDARDAWQLSGLATPDHQLVRGRAAAALNTLLKQAMVDRKQIAGVGYGIGGTALIELARTGVDLEGVICIRGPVTLARPSDKEQIQPTFLVLVGADDPRVPGEQLKAFEDEIHRAKVECTVTRYPGMVDKFDEPTAEKASDAIRAYLADEIPLHNPAKAAEAARAPVVVPSHVPAKVAEVLKYVTEHGEAMDGYEGGRTFGNYERRLPDKDTTGRRVKYREWDVNPHVGNRGVERLITGSNGAAYFTSDHYETFTKLR